MGGELKNRVRLSITLPEDLAGRVRAIAEGDGDTISAVVERLLSERIENAEMRSRVARDPLADALIEQLLSPENIERAKSILGHSSETDQDLQARRESAISNHTRSGTKR
jgi:predicted transcriptional regulator